MPVADHQPEQRTRLRTWQTITLLNLFTGYAGYYVCRSNWSIVKPLLIEGEGMTLEQLGAISSIGVALYAIGKVSNGVLADFFGGRTMFVLGMMASAVCCMTFGFASGLTVLGGLWALNRYVQSMGWVALVKTASRWFPVRRHATIMGFLSMSYLFGDAIARLYLGLWIDDETNNWRTVFIVSAITVAVLSLVVLALLRSSPRDLGLPEPPASPRNVYGDDGESARPKNLGALLGPLLAAPMFWWICALNFALTMIRESFNDWNPTFLTQAVGMQPSEAAITSLVFPTVGAVAALVAGRISDALGGRHGSVIVPSLIGLIVALVALAVLDLHGQPALAVTLIGAVAFFLIGPYSFLSGVMALDFGGKQGSSTAAGLIDSVGYAGAIVSGYGIGYLAGHFGWRGSFTFLAGIAVVAAVVGWIYHRKHDAIATGSDCDTR